MIRLIVMRWRDNSKKDKLIIIGNGFDLAHEFETDYKSFVHHVQDPALTEFERMCDGIPQIEKWTQFEENIKTIVNDYYYRIVLTDVSADSSKEIERINSIYKQIKELLKSYLRQETAHSLKLKNSIKRAFSGNETVLCFNYTDTATQYTNKSNIVYVHGSLDEDDIVLGYDGAIDLCLVGYEESLWNKQICRENLAFRRMLREKGFSIENEQYDKLADAFIEYQRWSYSGRGADDPDLRNKTRYYDIIHDFLTRLDPIPSIQQVPYEDVKDICIMGHGLEADREYLKAIFCNCKNAKRAFLYFYEGEKKRERKAKIEFLKKHFEIVVDEQY